MNCDLFIRWYWKDLGWLALCLPSIERCCRGFRDPIVGFPRSSAAWLRRATLPQLGGLDLRAGRRSVIEALLD